MSVDFELIFCNPVFKTNVGHAQLDLFISKRMTSELPHFESNCCNTEAAKVKKKKRRRRKKKGLEVELETERWREMERAEKEPS